MDTGKKLLEISGLLNKAYGRPRRFKRSDPVDELVRTVLSQNTNDRNSLGAFAALKRDFKSWNIVLKAPTAAIAKSIRHAGLANIKARRIKDVLKEIYRREGGLSLSALNDMDPQAALDYLRSLKGVGPKTAACVLLFSFYKPVMPVDTHIFRVIKRLGLISPGTGIEDAHAIITDMSAAALRSRRVSAPLRAAVAASDKEISALIYELHLGIIEHGRRTCKAQNPRCGFCVLYNMCRFADKSIFKRKNNSDT